MSDFDTVLERLLSDPSFASALATDRAAALAGFTLSADEVDLLSTQFSADLGGESMVETRTNKSSVFGLLQSLPGLGETGAGAGSGGTGSGAVGGVAMGGAVAASHHLSGGGGGSGIGGSLSGLTDGGSAGFGGPGDGLSGVTGIDSPGGGAGFSGVQTSGLDGVLNDQFDPGAGHGQAGFGPAEAQLPGAAQPPTGQSPPAGEPPIAPPKGYHTHVDVDGDGHWDHHTLRGRRDGGVDILVDMNHDGRPDFIGHDNDADGLVESADYDKNHDGVFETHMYDDNGDGWLDRTVVDRTPPPVQAFDQDMGRPFGAASVDPGLVPDPPQASGGEGLGLTLGAAGMDPDLVPDPPSPDLGRT